MKTLISGMVVMTLFGSGTLMAAQQKFVAADNNLETRICMAVTSNDSVVLKKTLQEAGEQRSAVFRTVHCNKMPIQQFADSFGFQESSDFLKDEKQTARLAANLAN
jgi:hypothetical protein